MTLNTVSPTCHNFNVVIFCFFVLILTDVCAPQWRISLHTFQHLPPVEKPPIQVNTYHP